MTNTGEFRNLQWQTDAGLPAMIVVRGGGAARYACGYVGVPAKYSTHGQRYPFIEERLKHSMPLSFSGHVVPLVDADCSYWWIGFDMVSDPSPIDAQIKIARERCEALAAQIDMLEASAA